MGRRSRCTSRAAPEAVADRDAAVSVAALNAARRIARRDPAQYQWTYKRYSLRPSGSGEDNPYLAAVLLSRRSRHQGLH